MGTRNGQKFVKCRRQKIESWVIKIGKQFFKFLIADNYMRSRAFNGKGKLIFNERGPNQSNVVLICRIVLVAMVQNHRNSNIKVKLVRRLRCFNVCE